MPSLAEFDAVVEVGGDGGASMVVWGCQNTRVHHALSVGERWNERMELMGENIKKTSPRTESHTTDFRHFTGPARHHA